MASLCTHTVSSPLINSTAAVSSYGLVFTIAPPPSGDQLTITTLGFYIDRARLPRNSPVIYEVYTLRGHYADPNRTNGGRGGIPLDSSFDFRNDESSWTRIATGRIGVDNMPWPMNYFRVPASIFDATAVSTDEVQSFYVTLIDVGALLYAPKKEYEDFLDPQRMQYCGSNKFQLENCLDSKHMVSSPILQIGESAISYPLFTIEPYFFQPGKFLGSIEFLAECSTVSPTQDKRSRTPSIAPVDGIPTDEPTVSSAPTALDYIYAGESGCHSSITTDMQYDSFNNTTASYGIVFPIETSKRDGDGLWITSLGFHLDFTAPLSIFEIDKDEVLYELYSLKEEGYYADPRRTQGIPDSFDYRGDYEFWDRIASGTIRRRDLVFGKNSTIQDYFQIPWTNFKPVFISPKSSRSFYLTMDSSALVFNDVEKGKNVGGRQNDDGTNAKKKGSELPPVLRVGEGVIGYPWAVNVPFLYQAKQFVGKIFYEVTCRSEAPSYAPSDRPSSGPTLSTEPTVEPSIGPSLSFEPTLDPSFEPSEMPTGRPTGAPSVSQLPSPFPSISQRPTYPEWPSSSPSTSLGPSRPPSSHPTISPLPTKSQEPTFMQPIKPAQRSSSEIPSAGFLGAVLVPIFLKRFIYS